LVKKEANSLSLINLKTNERRIMSKNAITNDIKGLTSALYNNNVATIEVTKNIKDLYK